MYVRFPLSLRNVEDLRLERGITFALGHLRIVGQRVALELTDRAARDLEIDIVARQCGDCRASLDKQGPGRETIMSRSTN
jgi:hypothetical protein